MGRRKRGGGEETEGQGGGKENKGRGGEEVKEELLSMYIVYINAINAQIMVQVQVQDQALVALVHAQVALFQLNGA